MKFIDLRSDTVTKPSKAMLNAMVNCEVGDDVYGEDPTVNKLESLSAEILGKDAAVFTPSGTQSNLLALLTHCERGDEYIAGQESHVYKNEGGGAAIFGSIQPQPLDFESDGTLDLDLVKDTIKPDDFHHAITRLLCLENTQAGKILPIEYIETASKFAAKNNLKIHLDGARIFNASIQSSTSPRDIAKYFDSVSICLSKGLGAPVGSVLCGNKEQIHSARRWRKTLGGGMRQAGILAAAGIFALENNILRLQTDHNNATLLAKGLANINGIRVEPVQTNITYIQIEKNKVIALPHFLKQKGIIISGGNNVRLVTHMDVNANDIGKVVDAFKQYFKS